MKVTSPSSSKPNTEAQFFGNTHEEKRAFDGVPF